MKSQTSSSPLSGSFLRGAPTSSSFAVSDALKAALKPNIPFARDSSAWINGPRGAFGTRGYDAEPVQPTATAAAHTLFESVKGLQGGKMAVALSSEATKKFRITVKDKVTGEAVQVLAKLITRKVAVLSYGKLFHFVKTNRGQSILDTRQGKRVSQAFCQAELRRILGATEGDTQFQSLVAHT